MLKSFIQNSAVLAVTYTNPVNILFLNYSLYLIQHKCYVNTSNFLGNNGKRKSQQIFNIDNIFSNSFYLWLIEFKDIKLEYSYQGYRGLTAGSLVTEISLLFVLGVSAPARVGYEVALQLLVGEIQAFLDIWKLHGSDPFLHFW